MRRRFSMGCAGSKDDTAATESKKESKDTAKPEDVEPELSAKVTNAAGRRVSKTVRRVAVRCAMHCDRRRVPWVCLGE